jgi:molecular chaperone GrpE
MTTEKNESSKNFPSKKPKKQNKETKELHDKIHMLEEDLKEKNDKLLRSYADFDNYKKRVCKQEDQLIRDLKKKYLSEIIDLKELLIRSLDDENPKDGVRLIIKQLDQFFENEHVVTIDCMGKPFDHTCHHAVTMVEKDDCEDQTIIEEIKKGYKVDEIVLRPSHVIVGKKKDE